MLKTLIDFKPTETVTLIPNSGVQFIDFGFTLAGSRRLSRSFAFVPEGEVAKGAVSIFPLEPGPDDTLVYRRPGDPQPITAHEDQIYGMNPENALERYDRLWLPFPFFRRSGAGFDDGPTTWARIKVVKLDAPDSKGNSHRLVLAFDTLLTPRLPGQPYTAPEEVSDATETVFFGFCADHRRNSGFMALPWVAGWLREQYAAGLSRQRGRKVDPGDFANPGEHWAAYMVLIDVIAATCPMPSIELADLFSPFSRPEPVGVSLVLDVGNSRMCGVLVEDAPSRSFADVSQTYRLQLRDLSRVEHVYSEPFESRIEFAAVDFGPLRHASAANRNKREAFWWPSPVRVGPEAARLASLTDGTEGASGLSSPKRYLWDGEARLQPWINNTSALPPGSEPQEIRGPMISRLTEDGTVTLRKPGSQPGLLRRYSRSSLYSLMLGELLIQATTQINSVDVRKNRQNSSFPRVLKQIILTLPTATPLAEQKIMRERIAAAVDLVWEVMGWNDPASLFQKPKIRLDWDEATCTHLVWLFNEIQHKFHGTPKEFFDLVADGRQGEGGASNLRIASIDMGGGTTDLMILRHEIAPGTQTVIAPQQVFREGFRLAGDDILKELVEHYLMPRLAAHLAALGAARPQAILADLFGGDVEAMSQRDRTLRGQLVAQILAKAAIGLMRRYEAGARDPVVLGDLLDGVEVISQPAIRHFEEAVRARSGIACDLLATPVTVDPEEIDRLIEGLVGPMVRDLCDLVRAYDCDILLVSGRPSQYAVIRRLILSSMPIPANRIIAMGSYRVGNWYPFRSSDFRIFDPKTTAVVGAMLCHTCSQAVGNMTQKTDGMKMKSTARYIGAMSDNGQITAENVLLDNVDLDTGRGVDEFRMQLASPTFLGFRQLPIPRWRASPLYFVGFARPDNLGKVALPLTVTFVRAEPTEGKEQQAMEDFSVDDVVDASGESLGRSAVRYRLQTMLIENQTEAGYWLDTGVLQVRPD